MVHNFSAETSDREVQSVEVQTTDASTQYDINACPYFSEHHEVAVQCDFPAHVHVACQSSFECDCVSHGMQTQEEMQTLVQHIGRDVATQSSIYISEAVQTEGIIFEKKSTCINSTDITTQSSQFNSISIAIQTDETVMNKNERVGSVDVATQSTVENNCVSSGIQTEELTCEMENVGNTSIQIDLSLNLDDASQSHRSIRDIDNSLLQPMKKRTSKISMILRKTPVAVVSPVLSTAPKLSTDQKSLDQFPVHGISVSAPSWKNTSSIRPRNSTPLLPVKPTRATQLRDLQKRKSLHNKTNKETLNTSCMKNKEPTTSLQVKSTSQIKPKKKINTGEIQGIPFNRLENIYKKTWRDKLVYPSTFGKVCLQIVMMNLQCKKKSQIQKMAASKRTQRELFEMLERKMDVNEISSYIATIIEYCNSDVLEYVLSLQDHDGYTALHLSVRNNCTDVMSLLISTRKCNIDHQNYEKETALILAAQRNNLDAAEKLVNFGADLNHRDSKERTALIYAAQLGYIPIVQLLLSCPDIVVSQDDLMQICAASRNSEQKEYRLIQNMLQQHMNYTGQS